MYYIIILFFICINLNIINGEKNCSAGYIQPNSLNHEAKPITCWGNSHEEAMLEHMPDLSLKYMDFGLYGVCGLDHDGHVYCFGYNYFGLLNVPYNLPKMQHITVGDLYGAMALDEQGNVFKWGIDDQRFGLLDLPSNTSFSDISIGYLATCGIKKSDNSVICFGSDSGKQISRIPTNIEFSKISTGYDFVCGINSYNNSIVCWGDYFNTILTKVPNVTNIEHMDVGGYVVTALQDEEYDNKAFVFGMPYQKQTDIPENVTFKFLNPGEGFVTCGIDKNNNTPMCWGQADNTIITHLPTKLKFSKIYGGQDTACGLTLDECIPCNPGRYSNLNKSTTCLLCEVGRYSTKFASSTCDDCLEGYYCINNYQAPLICPEGYFCEFNSTEPEPCKLGTYCPNGTTNNNNSTICPSGFYCTTPALKEPCPAGSYCPKGSNIQPIKCPAGMFSKAQKDACNTCPAGYWCSDTEFHLCSDGSYCPFNSSIERNCEPGHYCYSPAVMEICEAGYFCGSRTTNPIDCSNWSNYQDGQYTCPRGSSQPRKCSSCLDNVMISPCNKLTDTLCGKQIYNTSIKIPYFLYGISLCILMLVLLTSKVLKTIFPGTHPIRFFIFIFAIVDFISDVLSIIELRKTKETAFLGILGIVIMCISLLANSIFIRKIVIEWIEFSLFQFYVLEYSLWISIVLFVSASNLEAFLIISSKLFNLDMLSAPLTKEDDQRIEYGNSIGVVVETIPQFIIQALACAKLNQLDGYVGFALLISALQILLALIKLILLIIVHRKSKQQEPEISHGEISRQNSSYIQLEEQPSLAMSMNVNDLLRQIREQHEQLLQLRTENQLLKDQLSTIQRIRRGYSDNITIDNTT